MDYLDLIDIKNKNNYYGGVLNGISKEGYIR